MNYTDQWRQAVLPTWKASFDHPFITALHDGTLPEDTFRYYLIQDHHYLTAFAALHEAISEHLPAAQAKVLLTLNEGSGEDTIRDKMHAELGITATDFATTPVAPTAYAYISHMYYQLNEVNPQAAVAGLLPCYWIYAQIGAHLAKLTSPKPLYQAFFDAYASDDFTTSTNQMLDLVNQTAAASSPDVQTQMATAFKRSAVYESHFWQMAYQKERW